LNARAHLVEILYVLLIRKRARKIPPIVALSLVAADRSIVPLLLKPFGPTMV
jgi:hypothetical protein